MRKKILPIGISLAIMLLFCTHSAGVFQSRLIQQMDLWLYDLRLRVTMPEKQDTRIVIVDIDEKSLAEIGRWPWSRNLVAQMVDNLFDRYKVTIVGFDVVFAERDYSSGLPILEKLATGELRDSTEYKHALSRFRSRLDYDTILAASLQKGPVILGYFFTNDEGGVKGHAAGVLPRPNFEKGSLQAPGTSFETHSGYGANIALLQNHAAAAGHFTPAIDIDGVARRVPVLIDYKGNYYEALSVAMARALFGFPDIKPYIPDSGKGYGRIESISIGDMKIPVDSDATALIPYRGRQGSFPYVSATDVIHGRVKPELMDGAIVLVGTTASGLMDLRATPVSPVYAGVEIHANMIAGILDQNFRSTPPYAMAAELITLLIAGLLLSFLLPRLKLVSSILVSGGMLVSIILLNMYLWNRGFVLPLASSSLMISAIYIFHTSFGFLMESRSRRQITGLFGQYVPPEIVQEMSKDPDKFTMEADSREMTVLFSDVRNFTTISEGLEPKQLAQMMNEYMTPMTGIIYETRGTVDKYIGDAIMAFWGAPMQDPDHARHAIIAALNMQRELELLRPQFMARGWPEIRIGIGINSGEMRVGNMGSRFRMAYTALGDAVNLGARLEGITKEYGVGIVVGENTKNALDDICFKELDLVRVKGKNKPIAIFQPFGKNEDIDDATRAEIELFHEFLPKYRSKEWESAGHLLDELRRLSPEARLYALYADRIEYFHHNPPPADWDGVFIFTSK
jgi:adenylate cyclase